MYNIAGDTPVFGRSITVKRGCPIELSLPDGDPPLFTVGRASSRFEFCFEHEALRQFVKLGEEALTRMNAPYIPGIPHAAFDNDPSHKDTEAASLDTLRHLSWVWISASCPMAYNVSNDNSMFFRIGPPSNRFEPIFDVEALRSFVHLAREALAMIDDRDDRGPQELVGELACAGTASQQSVTAGQR